MRRGWEKRRAALDDGQLRVRIARDQPCWRPSLQILVLQQGCDRPPPATYQALPARLRCRRSEIFGPEWSVLAGWLFSLRVCTRLRGASELPSINSGGSSSQFITRQWRTRPSITSPRDWGGWRSGCPLADPGDEWPSVSVVVDVLSARNGTAASSKRRDATRQTGEVGETPAEGQGCERGPLSQFRPQ